MRLITIFFLISAPYICLGLTNVTLFSPFAHCALNSRNGLFEKCKKLSLEDPPVYTFASITETDISFFKRIPRKVALLYRFKCQALTPVRIRMDVDGSQLLISSDEKINRWEFFTKNVSPQLRIGFDNAPYNYLDKECNLELVSEVSYLPFDILKGYAEALISQVEFLSSFESVINAQSTGDSFIESFFINNENPEPGLVNESLLAQLRTRLRYWSKNKGSEFQNYIEDECKYLSDIEDVMNSLYVSDEAERNDREIRMIVSTQVEKVKQELSLFHDFLTKEKSRLLEARYIEVEKMAALIDEIRSAI